VQACYHLPCTLNTPDKIVLLESEQALVTEFTDIFAQLKQAQTKDIIGSNASFMQLTPSSSPQLILVCIDWDFIDENNQTFADFSAFYHLIDIDGQLKIINVVSHELENSKALVNPFELTNNIHL
jgi:NADH:ubiquinone oxidoreductase subunit C